jgi:tRNA1(Val) A37 N6-methylase TrmN6
MPEGWREGVREDTLLDGRVRLLQPATGHRAGTDAVLLAAFAEAEPGHHVVDVGAGTGAVAFLLAARVAELRLTLVERDPALAALAAEGAALNGLAGQARVVTADILAPAADQAGRGLAAGSADLVVTNPPFLEAGRSRRSPEPARAAAHELPPGGLEAWIEACRRLLAPKGRLALIHRADALARCLGALGRGYGAVRVRPVQPRAERIAERVLISAVKGSRAPLTLEPALVLHEADGRFTAPAEALHRGEAQLAPPR